ncbi:site-specific integrase [Clostridium perfringens]|nr:site-specific integrase [Clostridium perfringens]
MRDILEKLDELGVTNELLKEAHINKKNQIKQKKSETMETDFLNDLAKYKEDYLLHDVRGAYKDVDDRLTRIELLVRDAVEGTKSGRYPKGHILHMKKGYGDKLIKEAAKMFSYTEKVGESVVTAYTATSDNMQPYLNLRMYGEEGQMLQDTTQDNIKKLIQKINKLECIALGDTFNYSSNIKTRAELEEFGEVVPKQTIKEDYIKTFKQEDFDKIADSIKERLYNGQKTYDYEIAFLLTGTFGIRKETVKGLTIDDLNPDKGSIDIYDYNNKSEKTFSATARMYPSQEDKELLGAIFKRALLKNVDKPKNGQIMIITTKERSLYKGFNSMLKKNGIETDYGSEKFRALRRMYAQNMYDDAREIIRDYNPELADREDYDKQAKATLIAQTLTEVNYRLGHSFKHKNTTMGYIDYIH